MADEIVSRLLETRVLPPRGGSYEVTVHARPRPDGRWEGFLEFDSRGGMPTLRTGTETTQSSARAVMDWAAGLGVAFLEGAFERAYREEAKGSQRAASSVPPRKLDGPLDRSDGGARIETIALEILTLFRARGVGRIRTDELFNRTTHANADLVRAFELLEKRWRFVVRRTEGGVDRLELTPAGAREVGAGTPGTDEPPDPPQPRTRR
jgi:hypothetical protein